MNIIILLTNQAKIEIWNVLIWNHFSTVVWFYTALLEIFHLEEMRSSDNVNKFNGLQKRRKNGGI